MKRRDSERGKRDPSPERRPKHTRWDDDYDYDLESIFDDEPPRQKPKLVVKPIPTPPPPPPPKQAPPVNSLADLITMGESTDTYAHINMVKLRAVVPGLKKLVAMTGLEKVKAKVLRQVVYYIKGLPVKDDDYLHTVITGSPGTGKTTLAEILATIYCHLGLLSKGTVKRVRRNDMIGRFCGWTADQVVKCVKESLGGVLFIDEAYNLGGNPDHVDTFAKECVDTLNQCLSEYKKDFVCIIAGYEESLRDCFFKINPGLERRFPVRFDTGKYTPELLERIMRAQAEAAGWKLAPDAVNVGFFKSNEDYFKFVGGDTELLLTQCKHAYGMRTFGSPAETTPIITAADVASGFVEFKLNKGTIKKEDSGPPPGWYI